MKKIKKTAQPRWPVPWEFHGNVAEGMNRQGKIGPLPPGIREELNRRLQNGEAPAGLADWLNGPVAQAALSGARGQQKVTLQDLAAWEKGGFRRWQVKKDTETKIAQQCRVWVLQSQTREKLFGRRLSYFEAMNEMRALDGLSPLSREDIPPDEDWDTIRTDRPTAAEREEIWKQILSVDDGENEDEAKP
jgi:hypothetical protein